MTKKYSGKKLTISGRDPYEVDAAHRSLLHGLEHARPLSVKDRAGLFGSRRASEDFPVGDDVTQEVIAAMNEKHPRLKFKLEGMTEKEKKELARREKVEQGQGRLYTTDDGQVRRAGCSLFVLVFVGLLVWII